MVCKDPEVAGNADRGLGHFRHRILVSVAPVVAVIRQQLRQLRFAETDQIEIIVFGLEGQKLDPQHFLIPAGTERKLVIGDYQSSALRLQSTDDQGQRIVIKVNFHDWILSLHRPFQRATRHDDAIAGSGIDR
jgi:hypothetical protein